MTDLDWQQNPSSAFVGLFEQRNGAFGKDRDVSLGI